MSKMSDFEAMKALFTTWAKTGVPDGIRYPKTQSEAVGWKCEEFGIKGVGTKTYFNTKSPEYGKIVGEIKALIAELKPEDEVRRLANRNTEPVSAASASTNKRVYKSQKAKVYEAQDKATEFEITLKATLGQLHEAREALSSCELKLTIEQQTSARLRDEKAKLEEDNARLTRLLGAKTGVLKLVD